MKKIFMIPVIVFLVFSLNACGSKGGAKKQETAVGAAHNARNSLDWAGVYSGVIPAADGPGIEVRMVLYPDETYEITYQYIDREDGAFACIGSFIWSEDGTTIKLDSGEVPPYYKVMENALQQLAMDGTVISVLAEHYVLKKEPEPQKTL